MPLTLGLCCRGQQEAPPERAPYKPEGAPWRAALSEHAASNSTVGGLTGAALLKEWQQLQETAKKPRWCAAHPPGLTIRRRGNLSPTAQLPSCAFAFIASKQPNALAQS